MPKFSVKRPYLVLVVVLALTVLGVTGFTKMTTDFLPDMEFPYLMVITAWPGASPQRVESELTDPMESGLSTVNGVRNVISNSSENYSQITLEFEDGTNMDSAMVKVTSAINELTLPDDTAEPVIMEISADMIPTLYSGVAYEGKSGAELTSFINENVLPALKRQDGVAQINTSGMIEESVEISLSQKKINKINKKIKKQAEEKLNDAEAEIQSQENKLNSTQNSTSSQLADFTRMMNTALATKAAYESDYQSLQTSKASLEAELEAYRKNKVESSYKALNEGFASARAAIQAQMEAVTGDDPMSIATREGLQQAYDSLPADVDDAIANPAKLDAFNELMAQQGEGTKLKKKDLQKLSEIVNTRIPQIKTELANLETELKGAEAALSAVEAQIGDAESNYNRVEMSKISAAAAFGSGQAALASGKQEFESSKSSALAGANINGLLSMETLSQLLDAQNFAMPVGYIDSASTQYLLKIDEEEETIDEIRNTPLTYVDGIGIIRVGDVANIKTTDNAGDQYATINGSDAVVLAAYKTSSAGTSAVSTALGKKMKELEKEFPGLTFIALSDQGDYIRMVIRSVLSNLIWGALLAIFVLLLFLKDIRPTIVVAFSIPLSVLFALLTMYFTDITLNIISLSGLALGIGMLVDNSIVVIENIYRLRAKGVPAAQAAIRGANQVAAAIFASTLTTVCVFLPIVFTDGLSRQLLQDMCLTITYSLMASLIVALTVVPTLGSTLLKNDKGKEHRWFDAALVAYEKLLRFCLKVKIVPLLVAIALLAGCIVRVFSTGIVIIPEISSYQMQANMEMIPDLDDNDKYAIADGISDDIKKIKGVDTVGTLQSTTLGFGQTNKNAYSLMILLDHEYASKNKEIAKKVEDILSAYDLDDYSVSASGMDMSSMLGSGLEVNITGNNDTELLKISEDVMKMAEDLKGFEDIKNGQEAADQQLTLEIDKEKAIKKGLTVGQIYKAVYDKLNTKTKATEVTIDNETLDVNIIDHRKELKKENLLNFRIETTTPEGKVKSYPLKKFAKLSVTDAVASITHENGTRQITVTAAAKDGYNTTLLSRDFEKKLKNYKVPDGYKIELSGETESVNDMVKNMLLMLLIAVILIYLIMVAQFQNFLSPFIVMFTIPLAFTGGFIALMVSGQELSLLSMMGFLILSGVVVNNGIVFIDYANQLRREGEEKREALVETGKTRMRPILMTAMTTILGMSVMALSKGESAELGRGMATVTIGGLAYATLMTLIIVPVLYDMFYRSKPMKDIEEDFIDFDDDGEI